MKRVKGKLPAYSMLELLVYLTIVGIILSIGMASYIKVQQSAQKKAVQIQLKQYSIAVYNYKVDNGNVPQTVDDLLQGGYINKELSIDPWGDQYKLENREETKILKIISAGPDKQFGTKDDISADESLL